MAAQAQATRALLEAAIEAAGGPTPRQRKRAASPGPNISSSPRAPRPRVAGPSRTPLLDPNSAAANPGLAGAPYGCAENAASSPSLGSGDGTPAPQAGPVPGCPTALIELPQLRLRGQGPRKDSRHAAWGLAGPHASQQPAGARARIPGLVACGRTDGRAVLPNCAIDAQARALSCEGLALAGVHSSPRWSAGGAEPQPGQSGTLPRASSPRGSSSWIRWDALQTWMGTETPEAPSATPPGAASPPPAALATAPVAAATTAAIAAVGEAGTTTAAVAQTAPAGAVPQLVETPIGIGLPDCDPNHQQQQLQQRWQPHPVVRASGDGLSAASVPVAAACHSHAHARATAAPGCWGGDPHGPSGGPAPKLSATLASVDAVLSRRGDGASRPSPPAAPKTPRKAQASGSRGRGARASGADPVAGSPQGSASAVAAATAANAAPAPAVPAFVAASAAAWRISFQSLSPGASPARSGLAGAAAPDDGSSGFTTDISGGGVGELGVGTGAAAGGGASRTAPGPEPRRAGDFSFTQCGSFGAPLPLPPAFRAAAAPPSLSLPPPLPLPSCPGPRARELPTRLQHSAASSGADALDLGGAGAGCGDSPQSLVEPAPPAPPDWRMLPGAPGVPPPSARDLAAVLTAARF